MYSMGVILLELFQPFGTEMERTEVLTHLRHGQIPQSFYKKWPVQAKYVKLLTSERSTERPTAAQLRESELFHSTEHVSYANNLNLYRIKKYEKKICCFPICIVFFCFELKRMPWLSLFLRITGFRPPYCNEIHGHRGNFMTTGQLIYIQLEVFL